MDNRSIARSAGHPSGSQAQENERAQIRTQFSSDGASPGFLIIISKSEIGGLTLG
jgi:hypothetical protein